MNVFLSDYNTRLREWYKLRENLKDADVQTACVEVDNFWQRCPLLNHYLHPADVADWPTPWKLINDNDYCLYARALGMVYTLLLLGIKDIDIAIAIDDNDQDVVLVLVDSAKYALNYWPNSVLNINLSGFKILNKIDTGVLGKKLGDDYHDY